MDLNNSGITLTYDTLFSRRVFMVAFSFSLISHFSLQWKECPLLSKTGHGWSASLPSSFRLISCAKHLHSLYMCSENNCKPILWEQGALLWRSCGLCVFAGQTCFINLLKQHQWSWHLKAIYSDELNKQPRQHNNNFL